SPSGLAGFAAFLADVGEPSPWLPTTWAAEILIPLLGARPGEPLFHLALLASTAAVLYLGSAALVERVFLRAWSRAQEGEAGGGRRPEPRARPRRPHFGRGPLRLSGPEPRGSLLVGAAHGADPARGHLAEQVHDRLRAARRPRRGPGGGDQPLPRRPAGSHGGVHGDAPPRGRGDREPRDRVRSGASALRRRQPGADRHQLRRGALHDALPRAYHRR